MPLEIWPASILIFQSRHSPATFPVFSPHSPYARSISDLSSVVLWAMLGIFVIVSALVTYCIHKFKATPDQPTPHPGYGNTRLEVGYTISFFLILATIMVFAIRSMSASDPQSSQPDTLVVVAHQWWWEVRYPGTDIVTANEIHIPTGVPQHLRVLSADVIHDFWVPELGRKMDIIPGVENRVWFSADTPGTYFGTCAEYCGAEHA
ncbi:MAG: cytochrome c oxidase subunit II, partial [Candidatus Sulfotelmatobacter sp.]